MTGHGESRSLDDGRTVTVELRTVNNRHLKLNARVSDPYGSLEPEIERLVRERIRRGTVQLTLRVERPKLPEDYRLNLVALNSYRDQLAAVDGVAPPLASLLALPGIVEDRRPTTDDPSEDWPLVSRVVREALDDLQNSRAEEGRAMGEELLSLGRGIAEHLDRIIQRAPVVVSSYHDRLLERVQNLIEGRGIIVEPKDLIREVAILAERADVAEEITRLKAHLVQYVEVIGATESAGRKLEFIVQEMGRETNTIGSKSNDISISREIVEIKGLLEKIRELIQNVE
jgi:uncharacterized protein (TIGR00255 family)